MQLSIFDEEMRKENERFIISKEIVEGNKITLHISFDDEERVCPRCNAKSKIEIHDYYVRKPYLINVNNFNFVLIVKTKRYNCKNCSKKYSQNIYSYRCKSANKELLKRNLKEYLKDNSLI